MKKIKKPKITTVVYPVLKKIHPSETQPNSNSDSKSTKKSSNHEVNTNINQTPSKKKDESSQEKDDK